MTPGQLALALSQEDPEFSPSGKEIKTDGSQPRLGRRHPPLPCFFSKVSFNFPVCLSDHETLGTTPFCREIWPDLAT